MHQDSPQNYKDSIIKDIAACLDKTGCQPILFIGSGLSRRYFSGPSWDELLSYLAQQCPLIENDYAFYKQKYKDPLLIGEEFSTLYQQWAWGKGRNRFPAEMFNASTDKQSYIKYFISQYLQSITPKAIEDFNDDDDLKNEICELQNIKPHAVITTNYDQFMELLFPDYQPVIGQNIIRSAQVLVGEIFKIHGCVTDVDSIVITQKDFDEFTRKKKYLSAKLLTYFSEHPLLFVGYSATDSNIRSILSDIDECIPRNDESGSVIPNIFLLEWREAFPHDYEPCKEKLIEINEGKSLRIKAIETSDFSWVFSAFAATRPLNAVSPKVLRALLTRSYDLVRHDIPRKNVEASFEMLESAVQTNSSFAKLFGITTINNASFNSANFPYTLTELAEKVANKRNARWHEAQKYLDRIKAVKGIDIKASDNRYHSATRTGKLSIVHKYSDALRDVMIKMKNNQEYEIVVP